MSDYRSVSQYNQYKRCPQAWYLSRVERAWQRPAAWLSQGTAVHAAIEAWEKSGRVKDLHEVQEVYTSEYADSITRFCESTPNFGWWSKSGRYGGFEDTARRYQIGLEQTAKYLAWANNHPDEVIWIKPDGTPGIELEFDIELDESRVRGYIDAIIRRPSGTLAVRDHKTGNSPGDDFQLGVYKVAVEQVAGEPVLTGDYWMGRTGKPTIPYDLSGWTRDKVAAEFRWLNEQIEAGRFDPLPEPDKCRFCDVSYSCQYAMA